MLAVRMADMTGRVLEESPEEGITYLHGHGDIFRSWRLRARRTLPRRRLRDQARTEDAFGDYDADAIRIVSAERLGDPELIVPGLVYDEIPGEAPTAAAGA